MINAYLQKNANVTSNMLFEIVFCKKTSQHDQLQHTQVVYEFEPQVFIDTVSIIITLNKEFNEPNDGSLGASSRQLVCFRICVSVSIQMCEYTFVWLR